MVRATDEVVLASLARIGQREIHRAVAGEAWSVYSVGIRRSPGQHCMTVITVVLVGRGLEVKVETAIDGKEGPFRNEAEFDGVILARLRAAALLVQEGWS